MRPLWAMHLAGGGAFQGDASAGGGPDLGSPSQEYAARTVPVATFLSLFQGQPFEVQVSQSFHDGNVDFAWQRGCLMTAKSEDLWKTTQAVTPEDVRHMQSRVLQFECVASLSRMRATAPCARCMCCWIRDGAASHDAASALGAAVLPVAGGSIAAAAPGGRVAGLHELGTRALLPQPTVAMIGAELEALGAVSIDELTIEDWHRLCAWGGPEAFRAAALA